MLIRGVCVTAPATLLVPFDPELTAPLYIAGVLPQQPRLGSVPTVFSTWFKLQIPSFQSSYVTAAVFLGILDFVARAVHDV